MNWGEAAWTAGDLCDAEIPDPIRIEIARAVAPPRVQYVMPQSSKKLRIFAGSMAAVCLGVAGGTAKNLYQEGWKWHTQNPASAAKDFHEDGWTWVD